MIFNAQKTLDKFFSLFIKKNFLFFKIIFISTLFAFQYQTLSALDVTIRDGLHSYVKIAMIVNLDKQFDTHEFSEKFIQKIQKDVGLYDRLLFIEGKNKNYDISYWRTQGVDYILTLDFSKDKKDLGFKFKLISPWASSLDTPMDLWPGIEKSFSQLKLKDVSAFAHQFTDLIIDHIFGVRGYASYPIAYIQHEPKTSQIALSDCHGELNKSLYTSDHILLDLAWSQDAQSIAFVEVKQDKALLKVLNIKTQKVSLLDSSSLIVSPLFSKDGQFIFYIKSSHGYPHVFKKHLITGAVEALTFGSDWLTEIQYADDDQHLLVTCDRSGQAQIYQLDLHSKRLKRMTFTDKFCGKGLILQDEKSLIYSSFNDERKLVLFKKSLLDKQVTQLTTGGYDEGPTRSPAPGLIAFERSYDKNRHIIFKSIFSGKETTFLQNKKTSSPSWAPQPGFSYLS